MPEAVVATRRWRNQHLVREPDARHARLLWSLLAAMALATAPATVYVHYHNEFLKLSYELTALRAEKETLLELERRLRVRRAALESLDAIEDWAVREDGLVQPSPEQIVVIDREAAR
jgi:hypothetical protein